MTRLYEWVSKASIKHKLMMVNFMMITVPLVTLTLVTVILLGIFRFGDPVQNRKWTPPSFQATCRQPGFHAQGEPGIYHAG